MDQIRTPYQGIWNIIRFNWHFYLLAVGSLLFLFLLNQYLPVTFHIYTRLLSVLIVGTTLVSLLVSHYVYDLSGLYKLNWLEELRIESGSTTVNINAGFDETSLLLKAKWPEAKLIVLDFYDPATHTEVSIRRARKAYPPHSTTQTVSTTNLPLIDEQADAILVTLSAHEIRKDAERQAFFKELNRILKLDGQIVVTEHLRDWPNFLAYNIGFLHFLSMSTWKKTFTSSGLTLSKEIKITPFITSFILKKNGTTP